MLGRRPGSLRDGALLHASHTANPSANPVGSGSKTHPYPETLTPSPHPVPVQAPSVSLRDAAARPPVGLLPLTLWPLSGWQPWVAWPLCPAIFFPSSLLPLLPECFGLITSTDPFSTALSGAGVLLPDCSYVVNSLGGLRSSERPHPHQHTAPPLGLLSLEPRCADRCCPPPVSSFSTLKPPSWKPAPGPGTAKRRSSVNICTVRRCWRILSPSKYQETVPASLGSQTGIYSELRCPKKGMDHFPVLPEHDPWPLGDL